MLHWADMYMARSFLKRTADEAICDLNNILISNLIPHAIPYLMPKIH